MIVGFTGSREGMNSNQLVAVRDFLVEAQFKSGSIGEFHHGDCIGSDEQAFEIAWELKYITYAHPSNLITFRAYTKSDIVLPLRPPLSRNRIIVDSVEVMIAAPGTNYEVLRSGTWATIRYARKKGKIPEANIFYP